MTTKPSIGKRLLGVAIAVPLAFAGMTASTTAFAADASGTAAVSVPTALVSYDFAKDDGNGSIANTAEGSTFGAAQIKSAEDADKAGTYADGALQMTGDEYVKLPDDLLKDQTSATVVTMVKNDDFSISDSKWTYFFTFGGSRLKQEGNWAVSTHNGLYTSITATQNGDNESLFSATENLSTDKFSLLAATIDGDTKTANLYVNGRLVGSGTFNTLPNQFKAQDWNTIGNSTYPGVGDALFHGAIKSFSVYDTALTQSQIVSMLDTDGAADLLSGEADKLTVPSTASADFTVKTATDNATVTWSSDNDKVISVDQAGNAKVTPSTEKDETVTLTATLSPNDGVPAPPTPVKKTFQVKVAKRLNDDEIVKNDLKSLTIENANDMRSNFSVPTKGGNGADITWEVVKAGNANPKITDGVNNTSKTVKISRPAAGNKATVITLKATVTSGEVSQTKEFTVKVQPMPSNDGENEAYVWMYFTGEGGESQKVSIAASKGNNALDWNSLNTNKDGKAEPILTSTFGEKGLRDPFIMRSHDGDKFYLLATDLKVVNGDFSTAQNKGSKYLEIYESTDLVNWSKQRHVKVSSDYAGNTWAPEAYWDDELGTYVVYWASNLYDTTDENDRTSLTYNRMMVATTDDFITFSEPKEWINVDRRGQAGAGSIDVTVQKVGDTYYRIYKDENSMSLRQEKSTDLTAAIGSDGETSYTNALKGSAWTEVGTKIGDGQSNGYGGTFTSGEGPSLFPANTGDVNGYQYYLFADQPNYHGGPNHYVPFATNDIADASAWTSVGSKMPESQMPLNSDGGRPRHGTVLGVTRAEYQHVLEAYEPSIAVKSVDALDVVAKPGQAPTLPEQAHLTMADGTTQDVAVEWDEIKASDYAKEGTFTVSGIAQDDSRMPVEVTVTVTEKDVAIETIEADGLKVAANGTVTFAEPNAVKGYVSRAVVKSPTQGSVSLDDEGVHYNALDVAAGEYPFTVRYTMKDGSIIDVVYTPTVIVSLADDTHQRGSAHDPSIVKDGDTYYVFGSHRAWLKSKDLQNWEPFENNLSNDYATVLADIWNDWSSKNDAGNTSLDGNMWAPDVMWNSTMNKWCMYLSVNGGGKGNYQKTAIVLLTADSLDGDWAYVGPVVYSGFQDSDVAATDVAKVNGVLEDGKVPARYKSLDDTGLNAIDADVHVDDNGDMWMSFGSWFGGIWAIQLDPATGLRDYGKTYETKTDVSDAYYGVKLAGGYNNSGEGASFVKQGDYWYMFVSYGNLGVDGGYQIREFRSKSLTGPYVDQNGNPAIYSSIYGTSGSGANKTINRGLRVLGSAVQNGSTEVRAAQGGNEVYVDENGAIYNVYHTRFADKTAAETATEGDHELRVQQMVVSPDGWLVSTPYEYSGAFSQKTSYKVADVAGAYQIVVNDPTRYYGTNTEEVADKATRLADSGIVHAVNVNLNEDGTISGRAQGTWELDGNAVTLHVTASATDSRLMGDYTGTLAGQPNETGGYALVFGAVGGTVFTDAGTDVDVASPGATAIWGAKQVAWPSDEDPDNPSGPNTPETPSDSGNGGAGSTTAGGSSTGGLSKSGAAVLGMGGVIALLAAAGIGLTIWRKRRA